MLSYTLNGLWKMKKKGTDQSYDANVPTTMYQVLLENKVIEDPFYGENDLVLTKASDDDYIFTKEFEVDEKLFGEKVIEIEFKGLDTLATIKLNSYLIARTKNMHQTYIFDIKKFLKLGKNILVVEFASPTKFIKEEQAKFPLWGIETTMDGYEHIRKGHFMFGWDWGPQLPDMGIWRDVTIKGYSFGKLDDFYVTQKHRDGYVDLQVDIELQEFDKDLVTQVSLYDSIGKLVDKNSAVVLTVPNAAGDVTTTLHVEEPELWWPNGYGQATLYKLVIQLLKNDQVIDEIEKNIGLRTMTITREPDQWGETFDFTINGKRIFAMGADYIPEDALVTRPDFNKTARLIKDCAKANYNCLRVWGGGLYPNDDFFDLCDQYGLLVWQDFMFACGVYRMTDSFTMNVKKEFIDNIKRIRHHACLGLWCGNNEMEWGFVEWNMPKDERLKLEYMLLYDKLIPNVLEEYDPNTFYWPASPSSGGGFEDPNADNKGDVHYWNIFHGGEYYKEFRNHYFRFASEYGMQAFPDYKTVKSYAPEEQLNMFSPIMENHNKCIEPFNGNLKILLNMLGEFQLPKEIEDTIYLSQVFQGETIKCAVEHFRRNRGRCMGSTYWQVNDNYPVASWASIDYYGRWKAMHYYARRFYAPVLLSAYEEGTKGYIHITNETLEDFTGTVKWQIRHVNKEILESGEVEIKVSPLSAKKVMDIAIDQYIKKFGEERSIYLSYQLYDAKAQRVSSETILFSMHKYFNFPEVRIDTEVKNTLDGLVIEVKSDDFAKSVGIHFESDDLVLSDNYFDILPGESRTVIVEEIIGDKQLSIEELQKQIKIIAVNTIKY